MLLDLEEPKAEPETPGFFVLNKIKFMYERGNGRFVAFVKVDVTAVWDEILGHFELVWPFIGNLSYSGESLQGLITRVGLFGRIEDHPIAGV